MLTFLLLMLACEGDLTTWTVERAPEDSGDPAAAYFDPQDEGLDVQQECTGDPDPLGCCLDGCAEAWSLCGACGEGLEVCSAALASCTRACESYCGSLGCDGFQAVADSPWAEGCR